MWRDFYHNLPGPRAPRIWKTLDVSLSCLLTSSKTFLQLTKIYQTLTFLFQKPFHLLACSLSRPRRLPTLRKPRKLLARRREDGLEHLSALGSFGVGFPSTNRSRMTYWFKPKLFLCWLGDKSHHLTARTPWHSSGTWSPSLRAKPGAWTKHGIDKRTKHIGYEDYLVEDDFFNRPIKGGQWNHQYCIYKHVCNANSSCPL